MDLKTKRCVNLQKTSKILFSFFCWGCSALLANTFQKGITAGKESIGAENILAKLINPDGTIITLPSSSAAMMNSVAINVHNICVVGGYKGSYPPWEESSKLFLQITLWYQLMSQLQI